MASSELRDRDGIPYKYPARSCIYCNNYPCMGIFFNVHDNLLQRLTPERAFELHLLCNFAKYGCTQYMDKKTVIHGTGQESNN